MLKSIVFWHFDSLDAWRDLVRMLGAETAMSLKTPSTWPMTLEQWWTECRSSR